MEELLQFTKNLSPGITNMAKQVDSRREDLTNSSHASKLEEESEQVGVTCCVVKMEKVTLAQ